MSHSHTPKVVKKFKPRIVCVCLYHQEALGAVGAEREGDGSSVSVCQVNERRSSLRHVRQAAEPTVLHATTSQFSTTGTILMELSTHEKNT